jgi:uncharacterized membrane protein YeaQ/YmgE (transglycosylase-associated protein family)
MELVDWQILTFLLLGFLAGMIAEKAMNRRGGK